ncbi:O-antigen ligase family protein [Aureimonas leprariae]|uniref:O-antigen ligase family protein n=1 Tax=Plantimonas leprariae TaxID=2615207 RepID=UPI001FE4EC00|nr:O-antigen ligase family protein [Aureimonas leprariae]
MLPLLMSDANGDLGDPAKAELRLVWLPVYAFTAAVLMHHPRQFADAFRRNLLLNVLLAMPLFSVFWSIAPSVTLRRAGGLVFTVLLAYLLALRFTPRQFLLLLLAALGPCIAMSLVVLVASPGLAWMPDGDGAMRGIFLHKNSLGWYSCISALVSAVVAMDGSLGYRRTAVALLIGSLICLAGSTSMTATIAASTACCLIWFYSVLPKVRGVARVVFVLVFVQAAAVILITLHEFLVPVLEALGKDATLTGRIPLWEQVDVATARRLLLGYGYQAFWTEGNPDAWTIWSNVNWMAPHAHNGYRDILLGFGLAGMTVFAMVALRAFRQGAGLQCRAPGEGWLFLNVFFPMVLVMNLTESLFLLQNDTIFILFATTIIMFSQHSPRYATGLPTLRDGLPELRRR